MPWIESLYKPEYCEIAVKILSGGESLAAVCAEIGVARKTLYNWRDTYPEFANALEFGLQQSQRDWERIGKDGITGKIDKFAGSPWMFTMKNRFRDDYKEDKQEKSLAESLVEKLIDKLVD